MVASPALPGKGYALRMVELNDFVQAAILGVLRGSQEASAEAQRLGGVVNPVPTSLRSGSIYNYAPESGHRNLAHYQELEFDVAVTAVDGGQVGAKVGVLAGFMGGSAEAEKSFEQQTTTRLRFKIPIGLPVGGTNHKPADATTQVQQGSPLGEFYVDEVDE